MALPLLGKWATHSRPPIPLPGDCPMREPWAISGLIAWGTIRARWLSGGRAMCALLAVALGGLVWWSSRRIFGPLGGLVSLLLFVLDPTVLANGPLMTSDTACALFFPASSLGVWGVLRRISVACVRSQRPGAGRIVRLKDVGDPDSADGPGPGPDWPILQAKRLFRNWEAAVFDGLAIAPTRLPGYRSRPCGGRRGRHLGILMGCPGTRRLAWIPDG